MARVPVEVLIDSYSETNRNSNLRIADNHPGTLQSAVGQTFSTGDKQYRISKAKFYLAKIGNPDGDLQAILHEIDADELPTGEPLAVSNPVSIGALGDIHALVDFKFSGAQCYLLETNHEYAILVKAVNNTNFKIGITEVLVGMETALSHLGVRVGYQNGWYKDVNEDACFYVYGV